MNMKSLIKISLVFFILISVIPIPVSSLGQPIGVGGYVYDKDGLPVENASVAIWNKNTDITVYATTNSLGKYGKAVTGETGDLIQVNAKKGTLEGDNSTSVNLSIPTQWVNITIKPPNGGIGGQTQPPVTPPTPPGSPGVPPYEPPLYPNSPASVYDMYDLLKIMSLPNSTKQVTVMVIDTGVTPGTFEAFMDPDQNKTVNMDKIKIRFSSKYFKNGIDESVRGHGTFTNYEVAYILQTKCVNAIHISYRVFGAQDITSPEILLDALKQAETIKPDVISISIGAPGNYLDSYAREVEKLRGMGIIVVVAAGNYGPKASTVTSPAVSEGAIAVGSFDWKLTKTFTDDTVSTWSSRGPVTGVTPPKPDVAAPGESIAGIGITTPFAVGSGTSFACPLIAGGTAVVLADTKDLTDEVKMLYFWDGGTVPRAFEDALHESCIAKGNQNDWGAGVPQFDRTLTIFKDKLNTLIIQFIGMVIVASLLAVVGSVSYIRKKRATPWWKKTR